jgi:hypothetical protein
MDKGRGPQKNTDTDKTGESRGRNGNGRFTFRHALILSLILFLGILAAVLLFRLLVVPGEAEGSGDISSVERNVLFFDSIEAEGNFNIEVTEGLPQSVIITTDTNLLPFITTRNRNNVLLIRPERNLNPTEQVNITISLPELKSIGLSGATSAQLNDIEGESLELTLSGSSVLDVSGGINQLTLDASGASTVNALNLQAERARVNLSGAVEALVYVTGSLDVTISGSAELRYRGNPQITSDISGAGSLRGLD